MKRKLSPPHLRPSSKLGVPDYSSREARESFLEDQHAPQAKVRFNLRFEPTPLQVTPIFFFWDPIPLRNPRFLEASADEKKKRE